MPTPSEGQLSTTTYGIPAITFQIDKLSISEKSDYGFGKQMSQYVESLINGGTSSYFWVRNQRWKTNRNYSNGRINMTRFMDELQFNGKDNYININWQCIHIVNRIVSGLVGRWMNRNEKANVTAIDSLSTKDKQDEYDQLEFIIEQRAKLEQLQQAGAPQVIPQQDIPEDKEQLKLWQAQFQRLPEEILYELGINDVLSSNGWYDVLKEKMLHDSAETGFVGTYTWMDSEGVIHVEILKPENCFYSYSSYPDFRDTTWRGVMRTLKISELRKKYSKEFHPNNPHALTEEQIFEISKTAKEYQLYDNITWITEWNVTFLRPYDEWNVDVLEFEWKTVDTESYTVVTTKKNKSTIIKKGKSAKKADNEEPIDDSRINIYRGVYARNTQTMLEWGLKKNMIRPQDPKEMGNAEFSYSFYMVQNYDMTCLGVPEKIQEPVDQMIIARLKIQQLIASSRPPGTAVNWTAVQNIDYGLGEGNKAIDFKKMYDQTGSFYYHDKDAEGNPIGVPFTEISNAGFLPQLEGLMKLYQFHYQVMRDELGEDPNLISQAAQPRVAVQNIETSQQQAAFATDYYYMAYVYCMEDTAKKVSCLLNDSVKYGAAVYNKIIGQEDIGDRIFSTKIKLLPDEVQLQRFEAILVQSLAANPELNMFVNQFELMRVAKEDVKLGEALYRQAQKKLIVWQQQTAQQNQQATIDGQIKSAQAAEQAKGQNLQMELQMKGQQAELVGKVDKEKIALTGTFTLLNTLYAPQKAGGEGGSVERPPLPPEVQQLISLVIKNIAIPLAVDNAGMIDGISQSQQQQPPQEQQQPDQNQQPPIAA